MKTKTILIFILLILFNISSTIFSLENNLDVFDYGGVDSTKEEAIPFQIDNYYFGNFSEVSSATINNQTHVVISYSSEELTTIPSVYLNSITWLPIVEESVNSIDAKYLFIFFFEDGLFTGGIHIGSFSNDMKLVFPTHIINQELGLFSFSIDSDSVGPTESQLCSNESLWIIDGEHFELIIQYNQLQCIFSLPFDNSHGYLLNSKWNLSSGDIIATNIYGSSHQVSTYGVEINSRTYSQISHQPMCQSYVFRQNLTWECDNTSSVIDVTWCMAIDEKIISFCHFDEEGYNDNIYYYSGFNITVSINEQSETFNSSIFGPGITDIEFYQNKLIFTSKSHEEPWASIPFPQKEILYVANLGNNSSIDVDYSFNSHWNLISWKVYEERYLIVHELVNNDSSNSIITGIDLLTGSMGEMNLSWANTLRVNGLAISNSNIRMNFEGIKFFDFEIDEDEDGIWIFDDACPTLPGYPKPMQDSDSDGVADICDDDLDNDGVTEPDDDCPFTPVNESVDLDGDGCDDGLEDNDDDGDGILDYKDDCPNTVTEEEDIDKDGCPNHLDDDKDGDGFANDVDACPEDGKLSNVVEFYDLDKDGCPDDIDDDIDGDGVSYLIDDCIRIQTGNDLDGDGCEDWEDLDRDGDGILDQNDGCMNSSQTLPIFDFDGDGCLDDEDLDIDNDGIINDIDLCPSTPLEVPSEANLLFVNGCWNTIVEESGQDNSSANNEEKAPLQKIKNNTQLITSSIIVFGMVVIILLTNKYYSNKEDNSEE